MVRWEYIKKRRKWNARMILSSLEDKSWESFCKFFLDRGIEVPPRSEYDYVKDSKQSTEKNKAAVKSTPKKTTTRKRRTRKNAGKK